MKKLLFTTLSVGLLAAGANAAVNPVPPTKDEYGCYQIGTPAELYGFAAVVNGTNGQTANKTACGKLTANITDNGQIHETATSANAKLFAKALAGNYDITTAFNVWTPIEGFAGTFDGNGWTINGLFYLAESEAGFFKSVYGGAVIKNVKIADSYFRVNSATAGGLIAKVVVSGNAAYDGKQVLVDNCTFGAPANDNGYVRGTVAGGNIVRKTWPQSDVKTGGTNIGGLVGVVSSGTKIVISNSVNAGRVLSSYVDRPTINVVNYYAQETTVDGTNIGGLIAYVEPGAVASVANSYNTGKVDAAKNSTGLSATVGSAAAGTLQTDNVACASGMNSCTSGKSAAALESAFASYDQANLFAFYDAATVESIIGEDSHPGVVFSEENNGLVATITDASETFSIPQDIKVSKVVFNRVLKGNTSSTVALPFDIATSEVSGASFYEPINVVRRANDDERDTVEAQAVSNVVAYKSYVVIPGDADGSLVVDGAVVLKKTEGAVLNNAFVSDWLFINPIEMKRWDVVGSTKYPEGNNADEIGRVYGFAGANTTGAELGSFVRVATNVAIKPMRGYLKYTGKLPDGCKNALCKAATTVQMPESFVLRIVEPVVPSDEEQVTLEEGTTALQGMRQVPMAKTDRWFDLKGRSLNKKPANKGVFINNRKPIIVK